MLLHVIGASNMPYRIDNGFRDLAGNSKFARRCGDAIAAAGSAASVMLNSHCNQVTNQVTNEKHTSAHTWPA
jgi:hypothetical protein